MAYSITIPQRTMPASGAWTFNPASLLRHAPLLGTAVLEFAGLLTFLGVCVGLMVELS